MSDEKKLPESDGTDPLTLTNLILNHDARIHGYDWTHYKRGRAKSQEQVLDTEPVQHAFIEPGVYVKDQAVVAEAKVTEAMPGGTSVSQVTPVNAPSSGTIGLETNNLNQTIMSSDPKFNPCPAYLQSLCRVDGRPCPFSAIDYRECGKYYLAGSGDPELFEISPGREQSPEYQMGIKA